MHVIRYKYNNSLTRDSLFIRDATNSSVLLRENKLNRRRLDVWEMSIRRLLLRLLFLPGLTQYNFWYGRL